MRRSTAAADRVVPEEALDLPVVVGDARGEVSHVPRVARHLKRGLVLPRVENSARRVVGSVVHRVVDAEAPVG